MALATSMPLLSDLTMKFSRHSLHDSFQLPTSFNFYQCFEHAKDIALYNRFFGTQHHQDKIFEFTGSGGSHGPEKPSNVCDGLHKSKVSSGDEGRELIDTDITAYANPTQDSSCRPTGLTLEKTFSEHSDDELSSDGEELAGYFAASLEHCNRGSDARNTAELSGRRHNRKRSMELEESFDVKRCCRPRLNFEKMQLERGETTGNSTNYFRPISPVDS